AASNFSFADFPPLFSEHVSSAPPDTASETLLKRSCACFLWHLTMAAAALANALPATSPHLRLCLLPGTQPASSPPSGWSVVVVLLVVVVVDVLGVVVVVTGHGRPNMPVWPALFVGAGVESA